MIPQKPLPRKWRLFNRAVLVTLVLLGIVECSRCAFGDNEPDDAANPPATTREIATDSTRTDSLPARTIDTALVPQNTRTLASEEVSRAHIRTQKDTGLAQAMDTYLRRFHPDNALYVAVDPHTNEIIAWGERKDSTVQSEPDYLSRATFPAASLAKTITIAAAFDSKRYSIDTDVPLIGSAHTLYRSQIRIPQKYSGPISPVHLAYAKSYNPPIALIGMNVGSKRLRAAAEKFGFNRNYPENLPERSRYTPPDSGYGLAEVACGFTQSTTLSPLQAAAMVRAILMKKPLEIPWEKNGALGHAPRKPLSLDMGKFTENAYRGIRQAMIATATEGTARKHFSTRNISRRYLDDLDIGGKTGSLDGDSPKGRYDWFMGFAESRSNPRKAIVVVIMQAHGKYRTQVASQIAALLINYWAKENITLDGRN